MIFLLLIRCSQIIFARRILSQTRERFDCNVRNRFRERARTRSRLFAASLSRFVVVSDVLVIISSEGVHFTPLHNTSLKQLYIHPRTTLFPIDLNARHHHHRLLIVLLLLLLLPACNDSDDLHANSASLAMFLHFSSMMNKDGDDVSSFLA